MNVTDVVEDMTNEDIANTLVQLASIIKNKPHHVLGFVFHVFVHEEHVPEGWKGNTKSILHGDPVFTSYLIKDLGNINAEFHGVQSALAPINKRE
jgi:hypothetical protein